MTDFALRDLVLEVDKDITTDDIPISSKNGNKTGGDYPQKLGCLSGFKCSKCDQKFLSRVTLKYHEKAKQDAQKCEDCGFKSCTNIGFLNHMKKAHGKKPEQSNLKDSN